MIKQWIKRLAINTSLLWLLLAVTVLFSPNTLAAPLSLGLDIPYTVVADKSGQQTIKQVYPFLNQSENVYTETFSRGYSRSHFWLHFRLPAHFFANDERWIELFPNFIDDISLFYRPKGSQQPWIERRTGDTWNGKRGDIDYRYPVFVLPPPPDEAEGYEVVVRITSTSATLLQLHLWEPQQFLQHATRSSTFWAFYFGLAVFSSLLALILAILLKSRQLWSVTAMSAGYGLVACIQGYVAWLLPGFGVTLQHYLTSVLTLLSYAALLWMSTEVMQLKEKILWAHRLLIGTAALIIFLLLSLPLDLYQEAIYVQTLIYLFTGTVFVISCLYIWWQERFQLSTLILGMSPLIIMLASLSGLMSALGWLPFHQWVYAIWQYGLVVNMLLVIGTTTFSINKQHHEAISKQKMSEELRLEREARAHQRQFMGIVAHEFRTPLAVITASLTNLRYIHSNNRQETLRYEKIERATDRLVQLTDNCLADARLSAGVLIVERQPHSLVDLLISAASLIALSEQHNWQLTLENQSILAEDSRHAAKITTLEIDSALMRIAFSNVIDNAVKYSLGGTISIDVSRQKNQWVVSIRDQGKGIVSERVPIIFERYRRASANESIQGVGLGLHVSRQIARAHGGELGLAENTSSGCQFNFILPAFPNNNQST